MTAERSDVERARARVAETLDAIEYKLNVPKRASERIQRLRKDNPLLLIGAAVASVAAIAGVVWLAIRVAKK